MRKGRGLALTAWLTLPLGLILLVGSVVYVLAAYRGVTVASGSMEPTYRPGQRLVVERIDGDEIRRGDVVLFDPPSPLPDGRAVLKRVIATGGDRVVCCGRGTDERITVNGQPLQEPYVKDGIADGAHRPYDVKVPEGRLFVLGDHRVNSMDSRFYTDGHQGTIAVGAVKGRVVGPSRLLGWFVGAVLGLVLAATGFGFAIAAVVVRRRRVTPPPPPWLVQG